jgi:hypothetical protein
MKGRGKKLTFILTLVFIITGISWASNVLSLNFNISPESAHPNHELAIVTPVSDNLTLSQGGAQKIEGVGLYEISLGAPRFSDQVNIHILLTNPEGIRQALNNPNAFIDVAVWYPDESSSLTFSGIKVSKDDAAQARMSAERGSILLNPTISGQTTLYILASIIVPGGAPPGVQSQLEQLKFYIDVRM